MAVKYLWSGAVGLNDGTSWANAYTQESTARNSIQPGDILLKAADHSENFTSVTLYSNSTTMQSLRGEVVVVDRTTGFPVKAATPTLTASSNISLYGFVKTYGDYFSAKGFSLYKNSHLENCTVSLKSSLGFSSDNEIIATNTVFDWTGSTETYKYTNLDCTSVKLYGCTFILPINLNTIYSLFNPIALQSNTLLATGSDFSGVVDTFPLTSFQLTPSESNNFIFERCKFSANQLFIHSTKGLAKDTDLIEIYGCDFGNGYPESRRLTYRGNVYTDATTVIDDPDSFIDISSQVLSMRMESNNICSAAAPLESHRIGEVVEELGSKVITVDILEDFTVPLTEDELWAEVEVVDQLGEKSVSVVSGRVLLSATALSPSLLSWINPTAGSRAVTLSVPVTIDSVSFVSLTVKLGKYEAGKNVWINPNLRIVTV